MRALVENAVTKPKKVVKTYEDGFWAGIAVAGAIVDAQLRDCGTAGLRDCGRYSSVHNDVLSRIALAIREVKRKK
jgi:hypothetical protein